MVTTLICSIGARPLGDDRKMAMGVDMAARKKRQSSGKETMEMMVYVDKPTADYHGAANVEAYVATVLNVVSYSYKMQSLHSCCFIVAPLWVTLLTAECCPSLPHGCSFPACTMTPPSWAHLCMLPSSD